MPVEHSSYAPLLTMPDSVMQPEQVLWLHVLAQAVIDAASRDKTIKDEVRDWLEDEDFEVVCGAAGVNPDHVKKVTKEILRTRKHKNAFKKAMHFRFLIRSYVESNMGEIDKKRGLDK